jgi:phosphohistidine phosphatase
MKTLLLLRHAKSSWENDHLSDHERPLNRRGLSDAPRMGQLLAREELVPDLILSSTAKRAASTAEALAQAAGYEDNIYYTRELYHADADTYIDLLKEVDNRYRCVMMVGHNPGLEELVADLSEHHERMPTGAMAYFKVAIADWQDVDVDRLSNFELIAIWRPREL